MSKRSDINEDRARTKLVINNINKGYIKKCMQDE
jgi:hypothetical protein